MNQPKVSVIVPIYKVEKYIERCVRSLFEQTLDDIEYLFIDDCTPDDSVAILLRVLEEYPHRKTQVRIRRMNENSGQAAVRKWGLLNGTGEYVIHCDSDDYIERDMYERMYTCAKETDSDIVRCNFDRIDGQSSTMCIEIPEQDYSDNMKLVSHLLLGRDLSSTCDKLVRRSMISENMVFPKNNVIEDYVFSIQFLLLSRKTSYIKDCLYHYCQNPDSIIHKDGESAFLDKHNDLVENLRLAVGILESNRLTDRFSDEIIAAKYMAKLWFAPLVMKKKYFLMWRDTFPEIDSKVLACRCLSLKEKLKHLGVMTRTYPLLIKFVIAYYKFRNLKILSTY